MNMRENMPGDRMALAPPPPSYSFPLLNVTAFVTESAELKMKNNHRVPQLPQCEVQHTSRTGTQVGLS